MTDHDHKKLADMTLIEVLELRKDTREQVQKEKEQKCII
jgi:hypothetical protein